MAYETIASVNMTTGVVNLFQYINQITYSTFSIGLLALIYMTFLAGYYNAKKDWYGAFAVAGFITIIMSVFFRFAGLVSVPIFVIVFAIGIISTIPVIVSRNRY